MNSSGTTRRTVAALCGTGGRRTAAVRERRAQAVRRATGVVAAVGGLAIVWTPVAHATDHNWNASTGDYNVATNWNPNTVPVSTDNAYVSNGGNVLIQAGDPSWTAFDLRAGNDTGSTGTYTQTGSTVTANSWFRMASGGAASVGTYNMTGGVFIGHGNVRVGEQGTGYLNISGTSSFSADGTLNGSRWALGDSNGAVGYMNVSGQAVVNDNSANDAAQMQIGAQTGSKGFLTVSDSAVINANSNEIWVGQAGTGLITQTGGTINTANWIAIGRTNGVGTWNLSGGVVNKTGNGNITFAGATNVLNQTGGTLNNASETWVGEGANSLYNMSGGIANLGGNLLFAKNNNTVGNLVMTGGAMNAAMVNGELDMATATGSTTTATISGGTLTVGSATNYATLLSVGQLGTAVLNLSGTGVINTPNLYSGRVGSSTGIINATGGTINTSTVSVGAQVVGSSGNDSGTFNISGSTVVNATSFYVGKSGTATGTVTMTGGTLNTAQLSRGTSTGVVSVNLNGGTINNTVTAANPTFINGFNPGELNVNGVTINTGGQTVGVNGAISGSGFTVAGGGMVMVNSTNSTNTGTVNLTGSTVVRLAAPTAVIPTSSVAAFYPMTSILPDNSGGFIPNGMITDTSPNGNTLTPAGGTVTATTTAPPGAGHAGSLSFSNGGFLTYAYGGFPTAVPTGNAAYTIGAWINLSTAANNGSSSSTGNSGVDGIVGWGNYGTNNQVTALRTGYYGGTFTGINNYWWGDDGSGPLPNGGTTLNNWHYVAATYDPTAGSATGGLGVRTLYVDGTIIDTEDPNQIHNSQATDFVVGVTNILANPAEFFSGNMADLIIGTTAFTPAQLAAAAASDNPFAANTSSGQLSAASTVNVGATATLDLNGQNQTLAGLSGTGLVTLGAGTLTVNSTVGSEFDGTMSGTGGLTKSGAGTFSIGGPTANLTYSGPTIVNAGTLAFLTPTGASAKSVRTLAGGVAINGGTLSLPATGTSATRTLLVTPSLTIAQGTAGAFVGKLDLGMGDLDLKNASAAAASANLTTLTAAAASGFAGGLWTGNGLASATAAADSRHLTGVGVIANNVSGGAALYTSFDGQPVAATDILARYTYYGDTNLDGSVNAADYTRIDAGFLLHSTGWASGDFNYDGVVDGSDYTLMDNAFNQQTGGVALPSSILAAGGSPIASAAALVATSAVPEPATLSLLATGLAAGLLGRRRRISPVR